MFRVRITIFNFYSIKVRGVGHALMSLTPKTKARYFSGLGRKPTNPLDIKKKAVRII